MVYALMFKGKSYIASVVIRIDHRFAGYVLTDKAFFDISERFRNFGNRKPRDVKVKLTLTAGVPRLNVKVVAINPNLRARVSSLPFRD